MDVLIDLSRFQVVYADLSMNEGAVNELRSPEKVAIDFKKLVHELQSTEFRFF
jgi:hypothetical protein